MPYPPPLASGPASSFTASLKLLPLLHARHRLLLAELIPLWLLEITSAPSWTSQVVPALQDPELDCVCTASFVTSGNIPKLQGLDMERLGVEHLLSSPPSFRILLDDNACVTLGTELRSHSKN